MKYRGDPNVWIIPVSFLKDKMDLENSIVLDIGFGTGGFSIALAQHENVVTNFDIELKSIESFHDRIIRDSINNILTMYASAVTLPYKENTFDLVVLNGVLEYTANGQKGDPRETHVAVLKYVRRILKPSGLLYLGIENRYYLKYLLGYKSHDEMRFANVLPRKVANFLSRTLTKKEFRNYVYSYNEYPKLLGDAGFDNIEFYTALPNYKFPEYIIPIDNNDDIKDKMKKTSAKTLYKNTGYLLAHSNYLYKKVGPDFIILSRA